MPIFLNEKLLRVRMAELGIRSVVGLAQRLGLSYHYVWAISRGRVPSVELRVRMARSLRVRVADLWPERNGTGAGAAA